LIPKRFPASRTDFFRLTQFRRDIHRPLLFRIGFLAARLADFDAGIRGVLMNRFMAFSKLIPVSRKSIAFGILGF
jgi:hypothetical protein